MPNLLSEAIQTVHELLAQVKAASDPTAATLATAGDNGQPTARIVLIRRIDERGFAFFTNTQSTKGRQLDENPHAAICFFWDEIHSQVRAEGTVSRVSDEEADNYWAGRPRDSQIGAWASDQSRSLDEMASLESRIAKFEAKYAVDDVPRPPHWTGYNIAPHRIEFWSRGDARLHRRVSYELNDGEWTKRMLYP